MRCLSIIRKYIPRGVLSLSVLMIPLQGFSLQLNPITSFSSTVPGSDVFQDGYGATVRFHDDWVFVAAPVARPNNEEIAGVVYVYKKCCDGYIATQVLATAGMSDHLGFLQMQAHGNWLYISLVGTPIGPQPNDALIDQNFQGSIVIYQLINDKWVLHSAIDSNTPGLEDLSIISPDALNPLVPPFENEQGANFGLSFSMNECNRVLIVGAQYQANVDSDSNPLINVGAVYAFSFNDRTGQWELIQKITNPDGIVENDAFGACVVTNGDYTLISNAPILQLPKFTNSAVYVFKRVECDRWKFVQRLQGDQTTVTALTVSTGPVVIPTGDCFGNTMDLKGGRAVIGAPQENLGTTNISGAAYFYQQTECGLFRRVFKTVSTDPTAQRFSFPTIKIYQDKVYISNPNFSGSAGTSQGAIAVYTFSDRVRFEGNLLSPAPFAFEFFGESFDLQGKRIGVGTGLFISGFASNISGTPPLAVPLPYFPHTPFTIYEILN